MALLFIKIKTRKIESKIFAFLISTEERNIKLTLTHSRACFDELVVVAWSSV